jgi:sulfur carrier protein
VLERLAIGRPRRGLAVAVDAEVVPRSEWDARPLADGERVEVLTAIQGG